MSAHNKGYTYVTFHNYFLNRKMVKHKGRVKMTAKHLKKKFRLTRIKGLQIKRGYHIKFSRQKKVKNILICFYWYFKWVQFFPRAI